VHKKRRGGGPINMGTLITSEGVRPCPKGGGGKKAS